MLMAAKEKQVRELIISNELGLHARCATQIAVIARQAKSEVWIEKNGKRINAADTFEILSLECPQGTRIQVGIEDGSDSVVLEDIARLVNTGFGE